MFTFRRAILQATRYSGSWNRAPTMISQRLPLISYIPRANFSAASGLSRDEIRTRIFNVMEGFEKVDAGKLQETSSFAGDLGLDSLDAVEVVMAIEEDFGIEIPDEDADAIQTVQQAIDYISKTPEAHERDDRVEPMEKRESRIKEEK